MKRSLAALLLSLALPVRADEASVGVARPSARWLTAETAHVVLHYPEAFGEFGRHLSARMEPVHEALAAAIGYRRKDEQDRITVLVVDPFSASNGMAFPLLSHPYVVVWATPPESDSQIGSLRDWGEMLLAHELGHVLCAAEARGEGEEAPRGSRGAARQTRRPGSPEAVEAPSAVRRRLSCGPALFSGRQTRPLLAEGR